MKYTVKLNQKIYEVELEKTGAAQAPTAPIHSQTAIPPVSSSVSSNTANVSSSNANTDSSPANADSPTNTEIECPMPGKILSISVSVGQQVSAGQCLMVLEAMKMENEMVAPRDGTVKQILVSQGTMVNTGDVLAVLI